MTNSQLSVENPVVKIENLKVYFPIRRGVFSKEAGQVKAVDGVSFQIKKGEIFALVGESGCGKTTTAHAVLGLVEKTSGRVTLAVGKHKDKPVQWDELSTDKRRDLRRLVQVVFQDPFSSLNPRMTVREILEEPLIIHRLYTKQKRDAFVHEMISKVGLSAEYLNRYPHEFSGGQRQRIGIARALVTSPELLIADEPVSALDVSIQAQIINLLQDLKKAYNQTLLFISHDLALVRHLADRLAVMYLGKIAESGTESQLFDSPMHPYTRLLLDSVPLPGIGRTTKGSVSRDEREIAPVKNGCSFYPRCPRKKKECMENVPPLLDRGEGHLVSCFNPL
jgi:oligopeptide/dipeptide ABC transporter ATP-binding protein